MSAVSCADVDYHGLLMTFLLQKEELVGEDAAYFDVEQQSTGKWVFFTVELAVVLGIMYVVSPPDASISSTWALHRFRQHIFRCPVLSCSGLSPAEAALAR